MKNFLQIMGNPSCVQRSARCLSAALLVAFGVCFHAFAAESGAHFATVYRISGSVRATPAVTGIARELKLGDSVYVGDKVETTSVAEMVLRTDDAGVIAVRPSAAFVVERFSAKGTADDHFGVNILTGALRMITGWVGLHNKKNYQITTVTASIGIRGTDHEPYVLSSALAQQFRQKEGTYNRVYEGATTMESNGTLLDIKAGQVGFAPTPATRRSRSLMTALMPVLLEKVPDFYVPGMFDAELKAYAAQELSKALDHQAVAQVTQPIAQASPPVQIITPPKQRDTPRCRFNGIAAQWLAQLDAAITRRNTHDFVEMFDANVSVLARVKKADGETTEVRFDRDELARSTFTALSQLTDFHTRRPTVQAKLAQGTSAQQCDRIEVQSVVIEDGKRNGQSYRIESLETFSLARSGGKWRAIAASSEQR